MPFQKFLNTLQQNKENEAVVVVLTERIEMQNDR